jgi:hypothetical protein
MPRKRKSSTSLSPDALLLQASLSAILPQIPLDGLGDEAEGELKRIGGLLVTFFASKRASLADASDGKELSVAGVPGDTASSAVLRVAEGVADKGDSRGAGSKKGGKRRRDDEDEKVWTSVSQAQAELSKWHEEVESGVARWRTAVEKVESTAAVLRPDDETDSSSSAASSSRSRSRTGGSSFAAPQSLGRAEAKRAKRSGRGPALRAAEQVAQQTRARIASSAGDLQAILETAARAIDTITPAVNDLHAAAISLGTLERALAKEARAATYRAMPHSDAPHLLIRRLAQGDDEGEVQPEEDAKETQSGEGEGEPAVEETSSRGRRRSRRTSSRGA